MNFDRTLSISRDATISLEIWLSPIERVSMYCVGKRFGLAEVGVLFRDHFMVTHTTSKIFVVFIYSAEVFVSVPALACTAKEELLCND